MSVIEMKVPSIGESITEVTLSHWLKKDGEYVELDEPICEFESDKATLEFPAEASGKLIHVASDGDDLAIGALVARIDTSVTKEKKETESESSLKEKETTPEKKKEVGSGFENSQTSTKESYAQSHPSPSAAKIIREENLVPSDIEGTGKAGRITKEDALLAAQAKEKGDKEKEEKPDSLIVHREHKSFSRNTHREKLSRMRRTIASRLVSAKNETAMLTTFNEVDLTAVINMRKKHQDKFVEKYGIKLGFMSIFAKTCASVLMDMPQVNAFIDENELIFHDYVDISIAISTPAGLVVPPVHNVESLHFAEIEQKIKELASKAREGRLSLEEMQGGTFTITNGGIFGSMLSTPIINPPQSAILGMHAIKDRPVVVNGNIEIRPMMYLALSYDHRVIDGSSSVSFLVNVIELLEDPIKLLLDL